MDVRVVASGLWFPEGPAIARNGDVLVTEIAGQRIGRVTPDGGVSVLAETGGGPNGAAFGPDGYLYVANNGGRWPSDMPSTVEAGAPPEGRGSIQRILPDGEVEIFLTEIDGVPLNSPNDLAFDGHDGFYFTDPRWAGSTGGAGDTGPVCYVDGKGRANRVAGGIRFPNGIGVRDDGQTLIVSESLTGMLLSFRIESPGVLSEGSKGNGMIGRRSVPDGFCFDSLGRIIVAGHETNALFVLDGADGRPLHTVELPDVGPTNCCFGGPDHQTLYVTSSDLGQLLALEWDVPGMVVF
ncbi:MAG: SMP-30/gluconolactonase/LRE family protein, partial [Actinomycetia bacterium]|nr:SMP-30/gluconolactonase/LRE family protein [Actinomycetes bacterium]